MMSMARSWKTAFSLSLVRARTEVKKTVRDSFTPCPSRGEGCSRSSGKDPRRWAPPLNGQLGCRRGARSGLRPKALALDGQKREEAVCGGLKVPWLVTVRYLPAAALRRDEWSRLFDHFGQ